MKTVTIVGQGYVGLPMGIHAASAGLRVYGLDTNPGVVDALNAGQSHIDDVTDESLAAALNEGYRATTDPTVIAESDVVLVCVPTPLSEDGGPDLHAVERAADIVGDHIRPGTLAILESTTYPGTTEEVFAPRVTKRGFAVGTDVHVAFSPERIDPGNAEFGVRNTPKVVGGLTEACTQAAHDFYGLFVDEVVTAKGALEAEMSKLIENTFRHVNIALVNEMLRFSHELGIDIWDAIDCAATKPFGFMPFRPGPGVGGHCIPVDPSYLSHRVRARLGYSFRMVELAGEINTAAPLYVADRAREALNGVGAAVNGSQILLLGVSYKPNIADRRESPADPLARRLMSWGADLRYHDPLIPRWTPNGTSRELVSASDVLEAAAAADVVVLLQDHAAYGDLHDIAARSRILLDTRGVARSVPSVLAL